MSFRLIASFVLMAGCIVGDGGELSDVDDADIGERYATANPFAAPMTAVKWWNPLEGPERASSYGLELPNGITYAGAIKKLCNQGVDTVFVRHAEPKVMYWEGGGGPCTGLSPAQCRDAIDTQIADALVALRDNTSCTKKPRVYIMQRQWMFDTAKVDELVNAELVPLLNKLESRGVKYLVDGFAFVENRLDGSCAVKNKAVDVALKINAATGGWLKNKVLMFSGAGLGMRFKSINDPASCPRTLASTLRALKAETRAFSFIYKHFENTESNICAAEWTAKRDAADDGTLEAPQAKEFLLRGCPGLEDLIAGIRNQRAEFPAHANVTFWGDDGDGVTNIPAPFLTALREIFVTDRDAPNTKHAVFNRLFLAKPAAATCQDKTYCKHLLLIDSTKTPSSNRSPMLNAQSVVYDYWANWN